MSCRRLSPQREAQWNQPRPREQVIVGGTSPKKNVLTFRCPGNPRHPTNLNFRQHQGNRHCCTKCGTYTAPQSVLRAPKRCTNARTNGTKTHTHKHQSNTPKTPTSIPQFLNASASRKNEKIKNERTKAERRGEERSCFCRLVFVFVLPGRACRSSPALRPPT